jgi:hypothetical protein
MGIQAQDVACTLIGALEAGARGGAICVCADSRAGNLGQPSPPGRITAAAASGHADGLRVDSRKSAGPPHGGVLRSHLASCTEPCRRPARQRGSLAPLNRAGRQPHRQLGPSCVVNERFRYAAAAAARPRSRALQNPSINSASYMVPLTVRDAVERRARTAMPALRSQLPGKVVGGGVACLLSLFNELRQQLLAVARLSSTRVTGRRPSD